jgi:Tfp pilus assembly protein PilN
MRAVNLLPKDVQRASAQKPLGPALIAGVALLLCAAVLYKSRADAEQTITEREADIAAIVKAPVKAPPSYTPGQQAAADQEAPRITALDAALKTRVPWDNVLRQISLVVPDDVTLQTLTLTAPVPADATAVAAQNTPGVTIVGSSYSQDGVARLLARLEVVPSLTHVELSASTLQTDVASDDESSSGDSGSTGSSDAAAADTGIVNFTITADVRAPGVVS